MEVQRDTCDVCSHTLEEQKHSDALKCPNCNTEYGEEHIEFNDAIVQLWDIEEDFDDDREVEFNTEKAASIHIDTGNDMKLIRNDVHFDDEVVNIRGLDEFIVSGLAISGNVHGRLCDRFGTVRIRYKDNEHQYIEMTNEADFNYRW